MSESRVTIPLDRKAIEKCLPHRDPFLLVDYVSEAKAFESIVGYYDIKADNPVFKGHFPGNPVYPGVLIAEGLAQIAGILGTISAEKGARETLLTELNECRFRKAVLPGDRLEYKVTYRKHRGVFFWFDGEASVKGQPVASTQISALMR